LWGVLHPVGEFDKLEKYGFVEHGAGGVSNPDARNSLWLFERAFRSRNVRRKWYGEGFN